jgi:hypothetical protein
MSESNDKPEGRTRILRHIVDERQLHRKIPVLKRLVPSLHKRLERLVWPNGRTMRITPIRLIGLNAERIHIFGDSHSNVYRLAPEAVVHYLGAVTMHRVGRDGIQLFALDGIDVKPGDALGFVFGEIDVRSHVGQQRDRFFRNPTEILETLSGNYFMTLSKIKQLYPESPIVVFSLVPPMGRDYPNFAHNMTLDYPTGPEPDRIAWTQQLNDMLRLKALRAGFGFLDQYTPFVNEKGLLDLNMTADGLHVAPNPPNADVQELACIFETP